MTGQTIAMIVVGLLVVISAALALVTARAQWESEDSLTRGNLLTPLSGVAIPLLVIANFVRDTAIDGFHAGHLIRAIIAVAFLLSVASVGSFYLGRTLHGTYVIDRVRKAQNTHDEHSALHRGTGVVNEAELRR